MSTSPGDTVVWEDGEFQLIRISDDEYCNKFGYGLPIREDHSLLWDISVRNRLSLSLTLVSLESVFGMNGEPFDDWKGTFGFEFLLKVRGKFMYLFKVGDLKGSFYYTLHKILDHKAPYPRVYVNPIEEEFSDDRIRYFVSYFYGFITGVSESIKRNSMTLEVVPFVNHVDCCNILYGYWQDKFHEEYFEDDDELNSRKEEILFIVKREMPSSVT